MIGLSGGGRKEKRKGALLACVAENGKGPTVFLQPRKSTFNSQTFASFFLKNDFLYTHPTPPRPQAPLIFRLPPKGQPEKNAPKKKVWRGGAHKKFTYSGDRKSRLRLRFRCNGLQEGGSNVVVAVASSSSSLAVSPPPSLLMRCCQTLFGTKRLDQ